jgi:hypothetical protein
VADAGGQSAREDEPLDPDSPQIQPKPFRYKRAKKFRIKTINHDDVKFTSANDVELVILRSTDYANQETWGLEN